MQWLEEINLYGNEIDEAGALLRSPEHTRALLRSPEHTLSSTDSTAAMQPALLHPVECVVLQRQLGLGWAAFRPRDRIAFHEIAGACRVVPDGT